MILFNWVLFCIICLLIFYIPGRVVGYFLRLRQKGIEEKIISLTLGISIFLLIAYILAWTSLPYLHYAILLAFILLFIKKRKNFIHRDFSGIDKLTWVVLAIGTFIATAKTATSGILTKNGWEYYGVNAADGLVHIARVKNFLIHFPPQHPALAGVEFRGYHYFYDFLLSRFSLLFGFSAEDLYFRFFSFFIALIFGVSIALFMKKMTKNILSVRLGTFLAFFGLSFGYVLVFINDSYNSMIVEAINMTYDPSVYLSLALFFVALVLVDEVGSYRKALAVALLLGVLAQIKVYVGLMGVVALVALTIYHFVRVKKINKYYIACNICTAIFTAATFFPNNFGAASLVFAPFLFYSHYIQQAFFSQMHWEVKRQIFAADNNYLRIIILYIQAIAIFWVVTLGPKLIAFSGIKSLFTKRFWKKEYNVILFAIMTVMALIPTFFVQSISIFDIGQFIWLFMLLMSIPTAVVVGDVFTRHKKIGWTILLCIMAYSLIGQYFVTISKFPTSENVVLSAEDAHVLQSLHISTKENDVVVVLSSFSKGKIVPYGHSLISAISGRSTYFEDEIIHYPLEEIYTEREKSLMNLHSAMKECDFKRVVNVMEQIGSQDIISLTKFSCPKNSNVRLIESSDNLTFYTVKHYTSMIK